jgi:hypothetical protein
LSEAVDSGSITWTQTSGTADPSSPHKQLLMSTELLSGPHNNITLTNNPSLMSGAVYSIAFNTKDLAGNAAATVTNTNITYDTTTPSITGTAPTTGAYITDTQVSYTLSEAVDSGSVTCSPAA